MQYVKELTAYVWWNSSNSVDILLRWY